VLPYPDAFFDAIFHVNVFYFWPVNKMLAICAEIRRTLKPGRRLVCGMELAEYFFVAKINII
jgi:SAM-dependent methyltransferase